MASPFHHYLYVLRCADGSLYTGYAPDVQARLQAHQAGRGAKYTKSHGPVELVAQARFFSKGRAMSAEAHFKQVTRAQKDALLAKARREGRPLEDVLRSDLPGFGDDTAAEFVSRSLAGQVDPDYRDFMANLLPSVDARRVVGVRTPALRRIARDLVRRDDAKGFLKVLPHPLFEEMQVHAFALGLEKDYDRALAGYQAFLPHVDNWATCDQLSVKTLGTRPDQTLDQAKRWLSSDHAYTRRFGIGVLMRLFLDEGFDKDHLAWVAAAGLADAAPSPSDDQDVYYVNMMRAWFFAEAIVRQPSEALPYLELRGGDALLDEWTRRKAIQKALESRRVSQETKGLLRTFRE